MRENRLGRKGSDGSAGPKVGDRPFLQVELRAFVHATEDAEKVQRALAGTAGFDLDADDDAKRFARVLQETTSQGHYRNPIRIQEVALKRAADVRRFWQRVLQDDAMRERLVREAEERLDDALVFWFRIDKQAAVDGRLRLTEGEDVILVRAKLATYPKDRATGLRFLERFFAADEPVRLI